MDSMLCASSEEPKSIRRRCGAACGVAWPDCPSATALGCSRRSAQPGRSGKPHCVTTITAAPADSRTRATSWAKLRYARAPAAGGGGGPAGSVTSSAGGGSGTPSSASASRSRRFSGLTSRCVMLRACSAASASSVCFNTLRMYSSPCGQGKSGDNQAWAVCTYCRS